jgi:amino-acid N-acetyltransferase
MSLPSFAVRTGQASDAERLYALVSENQEEGHLLPRSLGEIARHAERFVVAVRDGSVVGCTELAPLSPRIAEVRSLAVAREDRAEGVGRILVDELRRRAERERFEKLCAFTHLPAYFTQMGFSIVPHTWFSEKVTTDCVACPRFGGCGQYAMAVSLNTARACGDEAPGGVVTTREMVSFHQPAPARDAGCSMVSA